MTKQQRVIRYLTQGRGWKVSSEQPSRKYVRLEQTPGDYVFVGKMGAVRRGRTITGSRNIATSVYRLMLRWEDEKELAG